MFVVKKRCDGYDELIHTNYTVVFSQQLSQQTIQPVSFNTITSFASPMVPTAICRRSLNAATQRTTSTPHLSTVPQPALQGISSASSPRLYTQPPYRPLIVTLNPHSHPILSPCVVDRSMRRKESDPPRGGPTNHLSFYPLPLPASRSHRAPNTRWQVLFSDRREGRSGRSEKRRTTR